MNSAWDRHPITMLVAGFLIVGSVALGIHAVKSSFEAAAFNRITGKNVSTWDAMFVELRVQQDAAR